MIVIMIISCCLTFYATTGLTIKSQVLDLKTLPIFSPLKVSVKEYDTEVRGFDSIS